MRFLLFIMIIISQCGWVGYNNNGWQTPVLDVGYYSTTNQTLTSAQSGQVIIFTGTNNNTQFNLPNATVGLDFTIIGGAAKWMAVIPQSTDAIVLGSKTAGQSVTNSGSAAVADAIELVCMQNGFWYVKILKGTWA